MAQVEMSVDVKADLDKVSRAVTDGADDAERDVAREGVQLVRQHLGRVLKHPTGRYSASTLAEKRGSNWRVNGSRRKYGSWLEGTSRRNTRSRFKGYRTFERIAQTLQRKASGVAEDSIDKRMP